jgi:hypothetical protein
MTNSVKVIRRDEQFTVRIVEDGDVSERQFLFEKFAQSWAEGQKVRLDQANKADEPRRAWC